MNENSNKLSCRSELLRRRSELIFEIRKHFYSMGFFEVDTPSLVCSPGMEPHIRPIQVLTGSQYAPTFLPTSPEFAMKKVLAEGHFEKIFQVCKAYRSEPPSTTHSPEFTILEWYRTHSNFEKIMDDVEDLFVALCRRFYGSTEFTTKGFGLQSVAKPWVKLTVEECFRNYANLELTSLFDLK